MHDEPLVSILIATFRRPKALRKALDSAVAQTYRNLEIVVSNNDCEDDETNALCREFAAKDARISYHVQPVNIGSFGNGKFLMDAARGECCLSMNDDDWLSDNYVELGLRTLRSDPNCAMVHGGYVWYTAEYRPYAAFAMDDNAHESYAERILAVARGNLPTHFLCRTGLFREHAFFLPDEEKTRFGEDWALFAKMAFLGNIRSIPGATYHKLFPRDHVAHYADLFDARDVAGNDADGQIFLTVLDSVAYDSFYDGKLERRDRMRLVALMGAELGRTRILGIEHVDGIRNCLKYLWRHPFALFGKRLTVAFEAKKRWAQGKS